MREARVSKVEGSILSMCCDGRVSIVNAPGNHRRENTYIVEVLEEGRVGALVLKNLLGDHLETGQLVLGLGDDPVKGTKVTGRSTLVQKVDVDVLGNGVLAGGDGLEKGGLAATVLTQETVPAAEGKLESGILDQDAAVEDEGDGGDLDVLGGLGGSQDTGGDTIGETVLVHLLGKTLDLVELLGLGSGLILDDGLAESIELDFLDGLALVGLGGLLRETLLLGGGRRHLE